MKATTSGHGVMNRPVSTCGAAAARLRNRMAAKRMPVPAPRTSKPRWPPTARTPAVETNRSEASVRDDPPAGESEAIRARLQPPIRSDTRLILAWCAALPIPTMKRPRHPDAIDAPGKSNGCSARGVCGSVFRPIAIAIRPIGMLIANSHGHGPSARMPDAIVGPSVVAVATTSAL